MIWKPKNIPTYSTKTNQWSETHFETRSEFSKYIDSLWRLPGEYNLKNTHLWRQPALKFQKEGKYTNYDSKTDEAKAFWAFEKKKIGQGIIIDDRYIPGEYYFYLNYCSITDKIKGKNDFPEVWDMDYHFYLYCLRAQLRDLNVAVVKARQKGFEQPISELVYTSEGFKPMGELKVGTLVATPNGDFTPVVEIFEHPNKDVYEFTFMDGRKVKCGLDHLWTFYDKFAKKDKTLSTKELISTHLFKYINDGKNKSYRFAVRDIEPIPFPEQNLPIDPYILGCLLGDGTIKKALKMASVDPFILEEFRDRLPDYTLVRDDSTVCNYRLVYKDAFDKEAQAKYNKVGGHIRTSPLIEELKLLGIWGTKVTTKFIPEIYKKSSIEQRLELLRGLMDTDGHVSDLGSMEFKNCAPTLVEDMVEIARSLGIATSVSKFPPQSPNDQPYYRVYLRTTKYNIFKLPRKAEKVRFDKEIYRRTPLVKIEKLDYKEDSRCISIDTPDHLYLTRDFIPTHNTLKIVSRLIRNLWFVPNSVNKMLGYEEDFVNDRGSWRFASMYRDFLNTHTPWYRDFEPDESLNWEQKKTIIEGTYETKKKQKGLRSKLVAATTKKNPAKAVGGGITELFHEEAGIAPNMHKVLEFAEAATKMGGVTTGFMIVSGAVGELKDAKPLEDISFEPLKYGFLGVEDVFSEVKSDNLTALFVPDFWNYIANDVEKGLVKCYDEDGNSDIELAKKYLLLEERRHQGKDSYILWKSQHPWTLQDAFNIREENIFPVRVIKEHQTQLRATYAPLCIELEEDDLSKQITHKISYNKPITDLKVDPNKDNRGVIEIDEMPIDNPPYGLYYAGIDPIRPVNTVTSKSLMSVCIFKASHMKNGKLITDYPVARYTGRYPTWEETYHVCMRLCRFYNARIAVENNVTGFQEWAIRNNYAHYFMHRREIYIINELMPNSTIRDEIGIRMEGQFKEKALEFAVSYFDEILSSSVVEKNKEDSPEIFTSEDEYDNEKSKELKFVYGVSRVRDVMLLEETLRFSKKLNTDRLVAFMCALIAARSNTNRNLIISETVHDPFKPNVPKDNRVSIPSPLQAKRMQSSQKVHSPFIKRR
jgi:hypothetical protein